MFFSPTQQQKNDMQLEHGQELLDLRKSSSEADCSIMESVLEKKPSESDMSAADNTAKAPNQHVQPTSFLFDNLLSDNPRMLLKPTEDSLLEDILIKKNLVDLCSLPDTAEKYLKLLLAYYEYERNKTQSNDPNDTLLSKQALAAVYARLEQSIKKLLSYTGTNDTARVHNLGHFLTKIDEAMSAYTNLCLSNIKITLTLLNASPSKRKTTTQAAAVINALNALKALVCPLDTDLTLKLLNDNIEAAKTIANQKVTVILGNTGSGKTTLVHFLAGSTFVKNNSGHYEPVSVNEHLASFITSSSTDSETNRINAVTIDDLILCDTPGYKDTRGQETDIANGIGVADAIMGCDSVNVIVLMNSLDFGARGDGLKTLVSELEKFLRTIKDERILKSFIYIYPNFSSDKRDFIIQKINEYYTQAELVGNEKGMMILEDMLTKIKSDDETCFLDPLTSDREALFNKITTTPVIENPLEVFRQFVLKDSLFTLAKQVGLILADFKQAFLTGNVTVAQYKYNQLASLNDLIEIDVLKTAYNELNYFIENTTRALEGKIDALFVKLHKSSPDDTLEELKSCFNVYVQYYYNLRRFRDHHAENQIFSNERDAVALFQANLSAIIADPIEFCQLDALDKDTNFDWTKIAKGFKLLHKFQDTFTSAVFDGGYDISSCFSEAYLKAQKIWSERFESYYQHAILALNNNQLEDLVKYANIMFEVDTHLGSYLLPEQQNLYKKLLQEIKDYFVNSISIINEYVGNELLSCEADGYESKSEPVSNSLLDVSDWTKVSDGLKDFYSPLHKLWSVVNTAGLDKHMQDTITAEYSSTVVKVNQYLNAIIVSLQMNTEKLDSNELFERFEQVFSCLTKLALLDDSFAEFSNHLNAYLVKTFNGYESQLSALCEQLASKQEKNAVFSSEDIPSMAEQYNMLSIMRYSVTSLRSTFGQQFFDITKQQKEFIKKLFDSLDKIELLNNASAEQLYAFLVQLSSLDILLKSQHPLNPELRFSVAEGESEEKKKLNVTLRNLSTTIANFSVSFDPKKIDVNLEAYINIFRFLYLCQTSKDFDFLLLKNRIANDYLDSFHTQLSEWMRTIDAGLTSNVEMLTSGDYATLSAESVAQKQQAAKNISAALLQLMELKRLCTEKKVGAEYDEYIVQSTAILEKSFSVNGVFENFIIDHKNSYDINPFEISAIYGWISIINELKGLDVFLNVEQKFSELVTYLTGCATERENVELGKLRTCIAINQYASFISLIQSVNNPDAANADQISASLADISVQALENMNRELTSASEYQSQSLATMSAEVLTAYLSRIAELENYRAVSRFLNNKSHADIEAKIRHLLAAYNAQVTTFEEKIRDIPDTDLKNIYAFFTLVRDALANLPTDAVHSKLFRCIEDSNARLATLLTIACNRYNTQGKSEATEHNVYEVADKSKWKVLAMAQTAVSATANAVAQTAAAAVTQVKSLLTENPITMKEYSAQLFNLFEFLEKTPEYQEIYTQLINCVVTEIHLFTNNYCPDDYGWDLEEKYNLYTEKNKFIPQKIQELCEERITLVCQQYQQMKKAELVGFNTYSIAELMDKLLKARNSSYAMMIKNRLEELIKNELKNINDLFSAKKFDEAVMALDTVWLHINYCSAHNLEVSPSSLQIDSKLLSVNYAKTLKSIKDRFIAVSKNLSNDLDINESSFLALKNSLLTIKAFIALFGYYNYQNKHSDCLYVHVFTLDNNTEKEDAYIAIIQKVIHFAIQIKRSFLDSLSKNDFNKTADILQLLKTYGQVLQDVLSFILNANVRQYCQARNINFGELLNQNAEYCAYSDLLELLRQRYNQVSQFSQVSVNFDRRILSASDDDKSAFHRETFQAYEGLITYYNAGIYPLLLQNEADVMDRLELAKNSIVNNLTYIIDLAKRVVSAEDFPSLDEAGYHHLNVAYSNLIIAKKEANNAEILVIIDANITALKQAVNEKLNDYVAQILSTENIALPAFMLCLFKLKTMSLNVSQFAKEANHAIEHLLAKTQQHHFTQCNIVELSSQLQEASGAHEEIAKLLLNDHKIFSSFITELRNNKTASQDINYVCRELAGKQNNTDLNVEQLNSLYDLFYSTYWSYVLTQLGTELVEEENTQSKADSFVDVVVNLAQNNTITYENKVVNLMAGLFAYWSITEYEGRSDSSKIGVTEAGSTSLLQPHPTQIVAIFRLLGLGASSMSTSEMEAKYFMEQALPYLVNHLAEIKTGEGKSITLAVTAMIFALMGYDVDCACYSHYLSQRDYDDFYNMFKAFGLEEKIHYGTFDHLSERLIDEQHGKLRTKVDSIIRQTGMQTAKKSEKVVAPTPRILLLDEVDVFFSPNFCGRTYKLSHMFPHDAVFKLIKFIWEESNKNAHLDLSIIKSNPKAGYQELIASLVDGSEVLIENSVLAMLQDVEVYRVQKGNFHFDKTRQIIGYKQGHDIVYNVAYRYQTMFAYIDKLQKKEITSSSALRGKIGLLIECGEFSYAEIPKLYQYVLGATATLEGLCTTETELLDQILGDNRKSTFVPSSYGESQLKFEPDSSVTVVDDEHHFEAITANIIKRRIVQENSEIFFPIMVFLAPEKLKRYYDYLRQLDLPFDVDFLDQSTPEEEKRNLIHRANMSGKVTLIHKEFGRGTNFRCDNKTINDLGGPVVILADFPATVSEEIQEFGRTARQGDNGSVVMVLSSKDLKKEYDFELWIQELQTASPSYYDLNCFRAEKILSQHKDNETMFALVANKHKASMLFFQTLRDYQPAYFSSELPHLISFLTQANQFDESLVERVADDRPSKVFRTVFCIDATGSMGHLIDATKATVRETFKRALAVADENKDTLNFKPIIEMKFLFYRNYSSEESLLLQRSGWFSSKDIQSLEYFLNKITESGGMGGNEAVEVAFAHVNKLLAKADNNIKQIIWIGDMPANTRAEVDARRRGIRTVEVRTKIRVRGKSKNFYINKSMQEFAYDWNKTNSEFRQPVYFDSELAKIKEKNVSIHAYWVKGPYYYEYKIPETGKLLPAQKEKIENAYKYAANQTKGKSGLLNVNGENAENDCKILTNIITESILHSVGGEKLVEKYRVKYEQSHTGAGEAVSASVASNRASMFAQSAVGLPGSEVADCESTVIPRDDIKRTLDNYLTETAWSFSINYSGRSQAEELLKMHDNSAISDESISNAFQKWFEGGRKRQVYKTEFSTFKI